MRHGSTRANQGVPVIRAWKDYPLDDKGKVEVQLTAQKLKPYKPGFIISSDLTRDTQTGMIVADILGQPNRDVDFDARTWDMGTFEGQSLKEVNPAVNQLFKHPWEKPPGSSESLNDFSKRWLDLLDRKMYLAANVEEMRPGLIVTHGKNIAMAQSYIDGIMPEDAVMPKPAGFAVISVADDRSLQIEMMGKTENVIEDV
jgi:broad specificity phosphatase PhoE